MVEIKTLMVLIYKKFIKNKDISQILKGGAKVLIIKILAILINWLLTVYITRTAGATIYGNYAFFFTSLKILTVLSVCGVDTFLLKYIAEYIQNNSWKIIKDISIKGFYLVLLISITVSTITIIFSGLISSSLNVSFTFISLVALTMVPFSISKLNSQSIRSTKNMLMYAFIEFMALPLCMLIIIFLTSNIWPAFIVNKYFPHFAHLAAISLISIFFTKLWHKKLNVNNIKFNSDLNLNLKSEIYSIKTILKTSMPFVLATSSVLLSTWTTQFFLKFYASESDLGIYDAMLKLSLIIIMPLMAINALAAPKLSEFCANNEFQRLSSLLKNSILIIITITLPFVLLLMFFPQFFASFFGEEFLKGKLTLRILVLGSFINAATGPVGLTLQMTNNQKIFQNISIFSTVISIFLSFILIPRYGLEGAALVNLIFVITINGLGTYYIHKWLMKMKMKQF